MASRAIEPLGPHNSGVHQVLLQCSKQDTDISNLEFIQDHPSSIHMLVIPHRPQLVMLLDGIKGLPPLVNHHNRERVMTTMDSKARQVQLQLMETMAMDNLQLELMDKQTNMANKVTLSKDTLNKVMESRVHPSRDMDNR